MFTVWIERTVALANTVYLVRFGGVCKLNNLSDHTFHDIVQGRLRLSECYRDLCSIYWNTGNKQLRAEIDYLIDVVCCLADLLEIEFE